VIAGAEISTPCAARPDCGNRSSRRSGYPVRRRFGEDAQRSFRIALIQQARVFGRSRSNSICSAATRGCAVISPIAFLRDGSSLRASPSVEPRGADTEVRCHLVVTRIPPPGTPARFHWEAISFLPQKSSRQIRATSGDAVDTRNVAKAVVGGAPGHSQPRPGGCCFLSRQELFYRPVVSGSSIPKPAPCCVLPPANDRDLRRNEKHC
jgi:hypothetical protein